MFIRWFLLACVVFGLVFFALGFWESTHNQPEERRRALAQTEARPAALEDIGGGTIPRSTVTHITPDNISKRDRPSPGDVLEKIASLEQRLAAVERELLLRSTASDSATSPGANRSLADMAAESEADGIFSSLTDVHTSEAGQSKWGARATGSIRAAFADEPFFADNGGQIDVDCRQSTCMIGWRLPETHGRAGPEYDRLVSLGGYELLKLAAKNAENVGRLQTVLELQSERPRIFVVFAKAD